MASPVSASSTRSNTEESCPLKLKESCDDCSTSKVKCTREKPTCQRCARRGRPCVYAASRRNGRAGNKPVTPPPSVTSDSNPVTSESAPSRSTSSDTSLDFSSTEEMLNGFTNDQWFADQGFSTASVSSLPQWSEFDFTGDLGPDPSSMCIDTAPPNTGPPSAASGSMNMDIAHNPSLAATSDLEMALDPFPTTSSALHSQSMPTYDSPAPTAPVAQMLPPRRAPSPTILQTGIHSSNSDDCLAKATGLLLSLFPDTNAACVGCLPLDTVLERNRRAIQVATAVTQCPCSKDQYLIHILALVIMKVIAWYAAVVNDPSEPTQSSTSPVFTRTRHDSVASPSVQREVVLQGEKGQDGRSAAQTVMGELHGVQRLLKLFCARLGVETPRSDMGNSSPASFDASSTSSYANMGSSSLDCTSAVSEQLHSEIRARFRAVSNATIRRLRIT